MAGSKSKILLFGRTGSGKSTVANMLVNGNLSPPLLFPTSSGVRGKTMSFQRGENDDWVVVDTVGFGEGEHGSVVDAEARNKLYDFFVKISEESYNYYAYVCKWGKLDHLDAQLWDFFKQAFTGAEANFVIIFTHCSPGALEKNLEDIKVAFQGCERYIAVDFPTHDKAETSASARTRRNEKLRVASFNRLQEALEKFMLPSIRLCLRTNLKKGRILLMGTATSARNMIAKLLVVDGTVNMTSMTGVEYVSTTDGIGNDKDKSTVFEELEGRRWQVVNVLAFDSAGMGGIYDCSLTKDKAVTVASKLLASNFLTVLEHGLYSHLIYVEEAGEMPSASKVLFQEILKVIKWKGFEIVAVVVNYNGEVQPKVPKQFKEFTTICQVRLPNFNDSPETKNQVIRQHALVTLEESLYQSQSALYIFWHPSPSIIRENWVGEFEERWEFLESFVNPTAVKGLVYAYLEELQGLNKSSSLSKNLLQKITSNLNMGEVDIWECGSNHRTVFRSCSKHIAAQVACHWDKSGLATKYLRIIIIGEKKPLREGLEQDFIWGELQAVDKHHVDKKVPRLPLSIGSCSTNTGRINIWIVGVHSLLEKEFIENLSSGDTIILWMYPHPNPLVPHGNKFEIDLQFRDIGH